LKIIIDINEKKLWRKNKWPNEQKLK
jgi:hypothetical protein